MSRIDTRCLCGAIHLRIHHQPLAHCDDCQAVHGASYVGIAVFPSDAVEVIRGAPISWTYKTLPRQRCSSMWDSFDRACARFRADRRQGKPVTARHVHTGVSHSLSVRGSSGCG